MEQLTLSLIHFILFLLVYLVMRARHDVWWKIESDNRHSNPALADSYAKKWHAMSAALYGLIAANTAYLFFGFDWLWLALLATLAITLRWIFFDLSWNLFRGVAWHHIGGTAQSDKLFSNKLLHFTAKALLLIVVIVLIVYFNYMK